MINLTENTVLQEMVNARGGKDAVSTVYSKNQLKFASIYK